MKSVVIWAAPVLSAMALGLGGCADTPQANTAAQGPKDSHCSVTGSNLPRRDCRGDVTNLPPEAVERVMPSAPPTGQR